MGDYGTHRGAEGVAKILSPPLEGPVSEDNKCRGTFDQPTPADGGSTGEQRFFRRNLHFQRATRGVVSDTVSKAAEPRPLCRENVFIRGVMTPVRERGRVSVVRRFAAASKGANLGILLENDQSTEAGRFGRPIEAWRMSIITED